MRIDDVPTVRLLTRLFIRRLLDNDLYQASGKDGTRGESQTAQRGQSGDQRASQAGSRGSSAGQ